MMLHRKPDEGERKASGDGARSCLLREPYSLPHYPRRRSSPPAPTLSTFLCTDPIAYAMYWASHLKPASMGGEQAGVSAEGLRAPLRASESRDAPSP